MDEADAVADAMVALVGRLIGANAQAPLDAKTIVAGRVRQEILIVVAPNIQELKLRAVGDGYEYMRDSRTIKNMDGDHKKLHYLQFIRIPKIFLTGDRI